MARTPGSGWGAGNPTFQKCPCCGRKTLYFYGVVFTGDSGFRCTFSKRGCSIDFTVKSLFEGLIKKRNF
jgi:hypothetical protein